MTIWVPRGEMLNRTLYLFCQTQQYMKQGFSNGSRLRLGHTLPDRHHTQQWQPLPFSFCASTGFPGGWDTSWKNSLSVIRDDLIGISGWRQSHCTGWWRTRRCYSQFLPTREPVVNLSSQPPVQWLHMDSLKLTMLWAFTPWKATNALNQGLPHTYTLSELLTFTSTPLGKSLKENLLGNEVSRVTSHNQQHGV